MKIPSKEQIEVVANRHADTGMLLSDFPHHWISVKYGFEKGAEWMEQQLEPLITEFGMEKARKDSQSVEVMTLEECKAMIAKKYGFAKFIDLKIHHKPLGVYPYIDEAAVLYSSQFKAKADSMQLELEQVKAENAWFSVNDKLPEPEKIVRAIRTFGNGKMEEIRTKWVERTKCFDDFLEDRITHWQYIRYPEALQSTKQ